MPRQAAARLIFLAMILSSFSAYAQEEPFSFYGLKFGMTRDQTREVFPGQTGDIIKDPGKGMTSLVLLFDGNDRLYEMRARYARPDDPFMAEGLKRALSQKFIGPVRDIYPALDISIDEYSDRASLTIVILSRAIRELNIEFHKGEFLKAME
jgi:hypothetical protein